MAGRFMRLHTLNLDFCTALTSLQHDCFSCMPNLSRLSMCETRITNLWTTSAALSKLPSLTELRFQNCLCCSDTGPCPLSHGKETTAHGFESKKNECLNNGVPPTDGGDAIIQASRTGETFRDTLYLDRSMLISEVQRRMENLSASNEVKVSSYDLQGIGLTEPSTVIPDLCGQEKKQNEIQAKDGFLTSVPKEDVKNAAVALKKYTSHHPAPICFEKHYREYMIASLPYLEVLDNRPVRKMDRVVAKTICAKYYECLPYKRQCKESVLSLLHRREMGASNTHCQRTLKPKQLYPRHASEYFFSRSLSAAKLGSSAWPLLHSVSKFRHTFGNESKMLRPRQFEYHPSDPRLMVFGTLGGEIVVINHENGNMVSYIPSAGAMSSVLGLCWLKKYPSKLIAGSDNGSLKLLDINLMPPEFVDSCRSSVRVTFDKFDQLTSLHINSTDDQLLASGYSKDVALYDIGSGKRLKLFNNIHKEPINVAKFACHSPFMFATSSFDHCVKMWDVRQNPMRPCYTALSSRGNVMVCFSPDDLYLLVSAVDNEVKQLSAADGRLHMNFEIASTGSAHNYTRSYYMNGRDYVISGSCDEHVVRICCAQTGKRLRDVYLEDWESGNSMFVQSLRGDPFRHFNMSILAASTRPSARWEIIKVNLLASSHNTEEYSQFSPTSFNNLGG
ncbi:protein DWD HYPERSENSITIVE TO UV-B 1 isoform X2 [Ziziphus jujuba]|nr:protein DWD HYPERSENSITIVE TO UV-B 1 isoform X2 [Ziziphus jujuba]